MRKFFGGALGRALQASGISKEDLAYKVLPFFLLEIITRYLRVEVEGIDQVPPRGPCIVIANHSGYMGFDALMLGHQIFTQVRRIPHIVAHRLWFLRPEISVHAKKLGLVPATFENALKMLKQNRLLMLFPEGEEGNFKPSIYGYRLRRFRRGFVRLALTTGAPIVPAVVVGAEETHLTLSQIRWAKDLLGIIIPIPLNIIPLPARWHIRFSKPIVLKKNTKKANDLEYVTDLSRKIRLQVQKDLNVELKNRKWIFL